MLRDGWLQRVLGRRPVVPDIPRGRVVGGLLLLLDRRTIVPVLSRIRVVGGPLLLLDRRTVIPVFPGIRIVSRLLLDSSRRPIVAVALELARLLLLVKATVLALHWRSLHSRHGRIRLHASRRRRL